MRKNVMHGSKMHISCPNCHAIYDVPENRLEPVSSLRCCACHYSWPLVLQSSKNDEAKASLSNSGTPKITPEPETPPVSPVLAPASAEAATKNKPKTATKPKPLSQATDFKAKPANLLQSSSKLDLEPDTRARKTEPSRGGGLAEELSGSTGYEAIQAAYAQQDEQDEIEWQEAPTPPSKRRLDTLLWLALLFLLILPLVVLERHGILKWIHF